jgi:hypothetical protein
MIASLSACGGNSFMPATRTTQSMDDANTAMQGVSTTSGLTLGGGGDPVKGVPHGISLPIPQPSGCFPTTCPPTIKQAPIVPINRITLATNFNTTRHNIKNNISLSTPTPEPEPSIYDMGPSTVTISIH